MLYQREEITAPPGVARIVPEGESQRELGGLPRDTRLEIGDRVRVRVHREGVAVTRDMLRYHGMWLEVKRVSPQGDGCHLMTEDGRDTGWTWKPFHLDRIVKGDSPRGALFREPLLPDV